MGKTHTLPIRIYWEDTDAGGRVYHANYIAFAERGRTELLRHIFDVAQADVMESIGVIFVVKSLSADYMGYAILDDMIVVETTISKIQGAKIIFQQRLLKNNVPIVVLDVVVVGVDKNACPTRIPKYILEKYTQLV